MDKKPSYGIQLYENGWVQGAYIACSELSETIQVASSTGDQILSNDLRNQLSDSRNVLILLSQGCDIVASCIMEPTLEFVIARRPKKKKQPHCLNLNAQSSRFLEIKINEYWYKAEASKILQIPKKIIFEEAESLEFTISCLSCHDIETLARWRANRYMRIALPNKFVEKIKPLLDGGIFNEGLVHAGGLYLQLDPFEESNQYIVRLFALHRRKSLVETFDPLFNKMESILEAINKINGLTCPFIEGEKSPDFEEVMPAMRRNEVSIELRDHFVKWNFDYISLKTNDCLGIDED